MEEGTWHWYTQRDIKLGSSVWKADLTEVLLFIWLLVLLLVLLSVLLLVLLFNTSCCGIKLGLIILLQWENLQRQPTQYGHCVRCLSDTALVLICSARPSAAFATTKKDAVRTAGQQFLLNTVCSTEVVYGIATGALAGHTPFNIRSFPQATGWMAIRYSISSLFRRPPVECSCPRHILNCLSYVLLQVKPPTCEGWKQRLRTVHTCVPPTPIFVVSPCPWLGAAERVFSWQGPKYCDVTKTVDIHQSLFFP